jgi:hypothetical protein
MQVELWPEFLADQLSSVYRRAGVLMPAGGAPTSAGDGSALASSRSTTTARLQSTALPPAAAVGTPPPSSALGSSRGTGGTGAGDSLAQDKPPTPGTRA